MPSFLRHATGRKRYFFHVGLERSIFMILKRTLAIERGSQAGPSRNAGLLVWALAPSVRIRTVPDVEDMHLARLLLIMNLVEDSPFAHQSRAEDPIERFL